MATDEFRVSDHVRVVVTDGELTVQTREEAGRGKRFGTQGEVVLDAEEAERFAKWVFARNLGA